MKPLDSVVLNQGIGMSGDEWPMSPTLTTTRLEISGRFLKVEKVPSGNTLTFKTSSGETFIGVQGRSVYFTNEFSSLEVQGYAAGELITLQCGDGWILDSGPAPPVPLPVINRAQIIPGVILNNPAGPLSVDYSPNQDYRYAVLNLNGMQGVGFGIKVIDQTGVNMDDVQIYKPDGTSARTGEDGSYFAQASLYANGQNTFIVPMMGGQLIYVQLQSGVAMDVGGQFTNNWN